MSAPGRAGAGRDSMARGEEELVGFAAGEGHDGDVTGERGPGKGKKSKKASGGFAALGFSFPLLKGVSKRGYRQPTPIQRKSIPIALEGRDMVAMARTGSGKTACFVLPILEKLMSPSHKAPAGKNFRALILSPTRELALQTLKFIRELGKFTGLTAAAILGGDSIENQFSVLTGSMPDIVVATPGRFLHICVEMNLQLSNIKMIVFDEADRLFELGFGEQLREIVSRLPSGRQSLLFSATLPKMLVEFARAGLTDPVLLRLDVEWKLPSTLWLGWVAIRSELRTAALIQLLRKVLTPQTPQAVVFAATKHHVEYLHLILQRANIESTYAYSGLDPAARKIALGRFAAKKCAVLLVTDVAARGLDLPSLDTVINYNFPAKSKLFVHRVGRCARAGRAGRAFSLVAAEDVAHLLDLHLFLGTSITTPESVSQFGDSCESGVWGAMSAGQLEAQHAQVAAWEAHNSEISEAARLCGRGWQQYIKWREAASAESNKRAKTIQPPVATHPYFLQHAELKGEHEASNMIQQIKGYTPKGNILELTAKNDSPMYLAMKVKRSKHGETINKTRENKAKKSSGTFEEEPAEAVKRKASSSNPLTAKKRRKELVRDENYIPHAASDERTEMGMAVNFNVAANAVELDMGPDSTEAARTGHNTMRWDRKRKKMVHASADGGRKMIRTESGGKIPATFRSGRYAEWQKKNQRADNSDDEDGTNHRRRKGASEFRPHWMKHNERVAQKKSAGAGSEMRSSQQIVKERLRKDKIKARLKHKGKGKGSKSKGRKKK